MKKVIVLFLLVFDSLSASADGVYPYASFAIGYKIDEAKYSYDVNVFGSNVYTYRPGLGGKDTAVIEVGLDTDYRVSFGMKHDSQLSTGAPFNDSDEYHKTEIFIRYKIGGRP
jgi:hypothetical protein